MTVVIKDKLVTSRGRWLAVKLSDILEAVEPFARRFEFVVHHTDGVMLHDWASRFTIDELDADPPPVLTWNDVVVLAREIKYLTDITLDGFEPSDGGAPFTKSPPAPGSTLTICCFDALQWEISSSDPEIASALLSKFRDVAVID